MTNRPAWFSILLLVSSQPPLAAETLIPADGSRHDGDVRMDAEGKLTVRQAGQEAAERFDVADIERVVFRPPGAVRAADKTLVEFRNGDRLLAVLRSLTPESLVIEHQLLGEMRIRPTSLYRLSFSVSDSARRIRREEPGVLLKSGAFLAGRCVQMERDLLWLQQSTLGLVPVSAELVGEAVIHGDLVHQLSPESILAVIVFASGEILTGALRRLDEHTVGLSVAWHVQEPGEFEFDRDRVAELFLVNGRVRYLSEMSPTVVKEVPYFSYVGRWQRNANVWGGPLRIGDQVYPRGLGGHSRTELVYELAGQYQWFRSHVGLDGRLGAGGDAEFRVQLDSAGSTPVFQVRVGGADASSSTGNIDVSQAQRLTLAVDYATGGSAGDAAAWGNALLVKKP